MVPVKIQIQLAFNRPTTDHATSDVFIRFGVFRFASRFGGKKCIFISIVIYDLCNIIVFKQLI